MTPIPELGLVIAAVNEAEGARVYLYAHIMTDSHDEGLRVATAFCEFAGQPVPESFEGAPGYVSWQVYNEPRIVVSAPEVG